MATIPTTVPFNYDDLFTAVQKKFVEKGYDPQPGSNTMQLATAMTYLISMLNVNTAVNINEMILTLARKRNNILQDARLLGYEPGNKISYQYNIELTLNGGDFLLPKYTEFVSGDKKYYYFGEIITIPNAPAGFKLTIPIKEGELIKSADDNELSVVIEEFTENGITRPQYYVDIPYTDVEDDGIEAFLTYYDDEGILYNKEQWKKIETFTVDADTILNKQFYRLNNIDYNTPRIYFKLPNTGDDLRLGTKIDLNILKSSGTSGSITEDLTTTLPCEITKVTLVIQGTEEETSESIKHNAPLFWNSANRAVTKNDYKSICERLTLIERLYIWDGNDEFPKVPGVIWFSFLPGTYTRNFLSNAFKNEFQLNLISSEENWFLEEQEVTNVFNYLDVYKIPTLHLIHRNPVFLDFEFDIEILKYDITNTESAQNELIFNIIDQYFSQNEIKGKLLTKLENFETEFFKSNLIKRIDTEITDITGLNLDLKTSIILYQRNIVNEDAKKFIIPLGLPYEDMYETLSGNLIIDVMPNINTNNFINNKNIYVDWSTLTGGESIIDLVELDIYLENDKVGKYKIFNGIQVLVEIFIDGIIISENDIIQKILNVSYKNGNIQMTKNTLPRLKKVNFK